MATGTDTAHRSVALELNHALLCSVLDEFCLKIRPFERKWDIHQRPHRFLNWASVKTTTPINCIIENSCLLHILLFNLLQSTLFQQMLKNQPTHINSKTRWGIVERFVLCLYLVIEHHWRDGLRTPDQVFLDNHNRHPRRTHILLCPSVDYSELRHIHRLRTEIGRHIRNQNCIFALGNRIILEFNPMNGLVSTNMKVFGIWALLKSIKRRDLCVFLGLSSPNEIGFAVFLRFLEGLITPRTSNHIIDRIAGVAEV
ncbi:hypothetical protein CKAN_01087000 [Cinnamomum micranthum f. kanehirae]|uniref:Uncharacterized protein n=1 Tax=Cinnamomum micranthum f. kanehirae TaxID=337451 RepID=A0A443NUG6_9MAGN|nr:hypothetical protein CKAN_01087000 [Cinnamomum micranthum f. kanehirae]